MSYRNNCNCGRDGRHLHGRTADGHDIASTTSRGLEAIAERRGTYLVDYYRSNGAPPTNINDAQAWHDYRLEYGIAGL
jgi:hypothetical protein